MAAKLNYALWSAGLDGQMDTAVFSAGHTLRMPGTENRKNPETPVMSEVINGTFVPYDISLKELGELETVEESGEIHPSAAIKLPKPDTQSVLAGCKYLEFCKDNPNSVTEPQWYAMLSVLARLEDGMTLAHAYSMGHANYSEKETELKVEQALSASGPRTCDNINQLWGKCGDCDFYGKCKSPILIQGEDYISSEENGYWLISVTKTGAAKYVGPDYPGLYKRYCREYTHMSIEETGLIYRYNGTHWETQRPLGIHGWMETVMNPGPAHNHCVEFVNLLQRSK